ncbi:esterase-like activity of phytase family protein [Sphingomonas canadensis]|uniref:Esterase-like activity of phytase family protein n=1 Tax=Sphingomonas canadensis TaxID=1219257 RepID=A0ABW3HB04_9SPHN|nr:esterase-like activity of phytase family protein [Sphingomonas canadensis]MCW3837152.1 esterase-like activity of phytase family protein [Sphingomonas canadensis]
MRRAAALIPLMFLLLLLPSSSWLQRLTLGPVAQMRAIPVPFDPGDPARVRTGALTWLGGVALESEDPAFGGFSAMSVDGDRFTLVSDGGNIVRFRMGADWQPRAVEFADLAEGPGTGLGKADRDAESMARDPATGQVWIGYESYNAIWRYGPDLAKAQAHARPRPMAGWGYNGGIESLARMPDGSFVAIAETEPGGAGGTRAGVRFLGDPADPRTRAYRFALVQPEDGYNPSDAVPLPDGRLLVLLRKLSPESLLRFTFRDLFSAKLLLVEPRDIRPGARVRGIDLATIGPPLTRDNLEALAVAREGTDTVLWIASDDNRAFFERSLLLKFRLDLPPRAPAKPVKPAARAP